MAVRRTAADAPAQLVELGETETLGVLDDEHRGIGHVDADFHDDRGHEHVDVAVPERAHDLVLGVADTGAGGVHPSERVLAGSFHRSSGYTFAASSPVVGQATARTVFR